MPPIWVSLLTVVMAVTVLIPPPASSASSPCRYQLGFATLHDLLSAQIGACIDDEAHNAVNGDGLQHSASGLLVWRKADNWTAFTDGYRTWVNGPSGIQTRLNSERFSGEANPEQLPPPGRSSLRPVPTPVPTIPFIPQTSLGTAPGTAWWWTALLAPGPRYIGNRTFLVHSVVGPATDEPDRQVLAITIDGDQKTIMNWNGLAVQDRWQFIATMLRAMKTHLPGQKVGVAVRTASSSATGVTAVEAVLGMGAWSPGGNDVVIVH